MVVIFFMLLKEVCYHMLTKAAFIQQQKKSYIVKYNYNLKLYIIHFYLSVFFIKCIPVMAKLNFQHHYSSLQCLMILKKSFCYADCKKHFSLLF